MEICTDATKRGIMPTMIEALDRASLPATGSIYATHRAWRGADQVAMTAAQGVRILGCDVSNPTFSTRLGPPPGRPPV